MMTQSDLDRDWLYENDQAGRARCNACDYEVWQGTIMVEPHPDCNHIDGFTNGWGYAVDRPEVTVL